MANLFISPSEPQYGIRNGHILQAGLTGLSPDANDFCFEILIKEHVQDRAFQKKLGVANNPYYCKFYGATESFEFSTTVLNNIYAEINDGGAIYAQSFVLSVFENALHIMLLARETSVLFFANGHLLRTTAKAAHDLASITSARFFNYQTVGGISCPSTGCLVRYYFGDFSSLSDSDILSIHRDNLQYPLITPKELTSYEKFRWRGRNANGTQILPAATTIENEINSETLAIQGGLNWGQARKLIYSP